MTPASFQDNNPEIVPVVLCGGSGTRLWPLSRESYPKQFIDLGDGHTLFGDTLLRVRGQEGFLDPIIICNEKYRFYVTGTLKALGISGSIVLEPAPRNTAPAVALAAFCLIEQYGENAPLMLIMPSDHHIGNADAFLRTVRETAPLAHAGHIITFGVEPTHAATGYGYIARGEKLGASHRVATFIEKPDRQKAQTLLEQNCLWNAGIFLTPPALFLRELASFATDIHDSVRDAWQNRICKGNLVYPQAQSFLASPEDSMDYAVMEKTGHAAVAAMPVAWDDLGSWESFFQHLPKDDSNNVCQGEVIADNVSNSYIRASDRLVAAIGVNDLAIIETRDAILVASRKDAQKVKNVVSRLKEQGSYKYKHHPLVYRPWGSYESLAQGDRFQVKRIIVNPGEVLSLQLHHHRAEHWIIVSGTAEITNNNETRIFTENQSTYIPIGIPHRLRNPGIIPLVLIEIQSGAYLGEDDIVRIEDIYGRSAQEPGKS